MFNLMHTAYLKSSAAKQDAGVPKTEASTGLDIMGYGLPGTLAAAPMTTPQIQVAHASDLVNKGKK